MVDMLDPARRSDLMARIRGKDTKPEKLLRSTLHRLGYRFRLHCSDVPGTPDIVFRNRRKVIQVHGCFWHRHLNCRHAYMPKSRIDFWTTKFQKNQQRDRKNSSALRSLGWDELVVWECELKNLDHVLDTVTEFLANGEMRT